MCENNEIQGEINALKQLLSNSDYQAIKHSEGEMTDKEYAPIREKRQRWRKRINELEDFAEEQAQEIADRMEQTRDLK